jgi:hypothetical protein
LISLPDAAFDFMLNPLLGLLVEVVSGDFASLTLVFFGIPTLILSLVLSDFSGSFCLESLVRPEFFFFGAYLSCF